MEIQNVLTGNQVFNHGKCTPTYSAHEHGPFLNVHKYLSEYVTDADKAKVRKNLKISSSEEVLKIITLELEKFLGTLSANNLVTKEILQDYLLKSELPDILKKLDLVDYVKKADLSLYVLVDDLAKYVTSDTLSDYITKSDLPKYISSEDLKDGLSTSALWSKITGDISKQSDLQEALNEIKGYTNPEYPEVKTVKDALDLALYKELKINMSCTPSIAEKGSTVESIVFNWAYSKVDIRDVKFNGEDVPVTSKSATITGEYKTDTTATLVVKDSVKEFTTSATLKFYPGIYYGNNRDNLFNGTPILKPSRVCDVTVDAGDDLYIWIAIPTEYGKPSFNVNGFTGGFQFVESVKHPTYDINFRIYKSDYPSLGLTTVFID